jgi:hypothetical protein
LIGCSLLIALLGVASFFVADVYRINPTWVMLAWLSVGFFAAVGWDYRREFRSMPFVFFFLAWVVLHSLIFTLVLGFLPWFYYVGAVFLELFAFYASASLLFGLKPPGRR